MLVTHVINLAEEDASYTEIEVARLRPDVLDDLGGGDKVAGWVSQVRRAPHCRARGRPGAPLHMRPSHAAAGACPDAPAAARLPPPFQIDSIYHVFIHGFPAALWELLPPVLAGLPRPLGGVSLELLGHRLGPGLAPPRPSQLRDMLDAFTREQARAGNALVPFWLAARVCPAGVKPDAPPPAAQATMPGAGDGSNPAGKLAGGFRDALFCLW